MTRKVLTLAAGFTLGLTGFAQPLWAAETCTTQSQMQPSDRAALKAAAEALTALIEAGDQSGVQAVSISELTKDFSGLAETLNTVGPKVKGGAATVEQLYLLDASSLQRNADGSSPDAQFFCSLNQSAAEADFAISPLPPGKYAFAIVNVAGASPWRLSFLLRQEGGKWLLAGFYPKPTTAAGHDGLWYWTEARRWTAAKNAWNGWLFYQEAQALLQPANFVASTHLEKLRSESVTAAPPVASQGISPDAPLIVKGADGVEYRFTAISPDNTLNPNQLDVALHMTVDSLGDAAAARKRNVAAMSAVLAAYPELRKGFHGIWLFAEPAGQNPYATELSMAEIP